MVFDSADSETSLFRAFKNDQGLGGASKSESGHVAHMLPRSPGGAILMTTRNKKLAIDLTDSLVEVPRMDDTEAGKLISTKLGHLASSGDEVHSLVVLLEYLPLALVQAAAYIQKTSNTISKYIQIYRKDERTKMRLLDRDFSDLERDQEAENALLKTWILSFEQIENEHPQAANLLSIMSYFDAQGIPESLLECELPDTLDLEDALATLKAFALVTSGKNRESLDMHRMVQLCMRRWLEMSQESFLWPDKAIIMLLKAYQSRVPNENFEKLPTYFPHAIAALATESTSSTNSQQCRASLLVIVGHYLRLNGQYTTSNQKFFEAIRLITIMLGDAHPQIFSSMQFTGENLLLLGKWDEARRHLLHASLGLETALGPNNIATRAAKINLAFFCRVSGERGRAKEMWLSMLVLLILRNTTVPE